jgi:hypothetical protein
MNPYQPPSLNAEAGAPAGAPVVVEPFTSVFGLFGRALSLYFGNLATIAAVTLAIYGPVNLAKCYLIHAARLEDNVVATSRVEMIIEGILGSLVTAALLAALNHKIQTGRDLGVREALSRGLRRWGSVFGARFLTGLRIGLGILLLVVPGVIWMVKFSLTDEVAALEIDRSAGRVMNQSAELTRGHGWKILGVGLLSAIPVLLIQFAGGMASSLAGSWVVTALVDCVADVVFRFFVPVMLLVYLGLGGQARVAEAAAP